MLDLLNKLAFAAIDHNDWSMALFDSLLQIFAVELGRVEFFTTILVGNRIVHTATDFCSILDVTKVAERGA